jgi:ribosomal protein S18 acetylase RimI-like enzyme
MNFSFETHTIRTPALRLDYHLVPWDAEIFRVPVAQITELQVADGTAAARDYEQFAAWCEQQRIALCACRVPADRIVDSMFLEERGFRFIELNYTPRFEGLQVLKLAEDSIRVEPAALHDRDALASMAAHVFKHGRFHQDPRIDPRLGDRRYRIWMENAFERPSQTVLKCVEGDQVVGFFVIEQRDPGHVFWSLIGLAPGLGGRGLGKRVWKSVLRKHQADGVDVVSTSISSHNAPVFNLYVSLGFRFPTPTITLQWRPPGAPVLTG